MAISQIDSTGLATGAVGPTGLSTGGPYWDTSGNLGIGTNSPTAPLHVRVATDANLRVVSSSGTLNLSAENNAGSAQVAMKFNGAQMILDSSGNLGIGTSSPTQKITIGGGATGIGMNFFDTASGLYSGFVGNYATWQGTGSSDDFTISSYGTRNLIFGSNGSERMRLTSNGGVSFGSSGTAYGSSGQVLQSNGDAAPTWVTASNAVKAWVNWNGTSGASPVIRASLNVSSVTRTATGSYTITFTSSLTDGNYAIAGTGQYLTSGDPAQNINITYGTTPSASSFQVQYKQGNSAGGLDGPIITAIVCR